MNEEWRDVVGWEGVYQVSDLGRARSVSRWTKFGKWSKKFIEGCILKLVVDETTGYTQIGMTKDGKQRTYKVHKLVLEAFVGPCPKGMECRHFPNGDRTDNRLCNLSWGTRSQKRQDRLLQGTTDRGSAHSSSKLTEENVREMRMLRKEGFHYNIISSLFNVSVSAAQLAIKGRTWRHVT